MGIDLQITISGQKEIKGLFKKLRKFFRQRPSIRAMNQALDLLQADAKFYAPSWHEDLRDSILTEVRSLADNQIMGSVFSDSPYAVAQERGVPAGYWMYGPSMEEWVVDNWDMGEDYASMGAFGLSLWLFANGLDAKWYFERSLQDNEMEIVRLFNESAEVILNSRT